LTRFTMLISGMLAHENGDSSVVVKCN